LETQITTAHLYAVRFDEKLTNCRNEKSSQNLQIPFLGLNEVQVMVRVGLPTIENRLKNIPDVGDIELGLLRKRMGHTINRLIPGVRALLRGVTLFEGGAVLFVIGMQTRILLEFHNTVTVPRINQIMPRPLQRAATDVFRHSEFKETGWLYEMRVLCDEHLVIAGRYSDANLGVGLKRWKFLLETPQESELFW